MLSWPTMEFVKLSITEKMNTFLKKGSSSFSIPSVTKQFIKLFCVMCFLLRTSFMRVLLGKKRERDVQNSAKLKLGQRLCEWGGALATLSLPWVTGRTSHLSESLCGTSMQTGAEASEFPNSVQIPLSLPDKHRSHSLTNIEATDLLAFA